MTVMYFLTHVAQNLARGSRTGRSRGFRCRVALDPAGFDGLLQLFERRLEDVGADLVGQRAPEEESQAPAGVDREVVGRFRQTIVELLEGVVARRVLDVAVDVGPAHAVRGLVLVAQDVADHAYARV